MKKIIFLSIIITVLFLGYNANAGNKPKETPAIIHYQVNIQNTLPQGELICPSSVMITDEHGYLVSEIQPFRSYVTSYHFYERGPVTGIRIAHLMVDPVDMICPFTPAPVPKSGTFYNGATYVYPMHYGPRDPSPVPFPVPGN
jgi:hypothetical protein